VWQRETGSIGGVRAIEMRNGGSRKSMRARLGGDAAARAGGKHGKKDERTTNER
jgi:hypothetical protein